MEQDVDRDGRGVHRDQQAQPEPFIRVPTSEQGSKIKALAEQITTLESQLKQIEEQAETNVEKLTATTSQSDLLSRQCKSRRKNIRK